MASLTDLVAGELRAVAARADLNATDLSDRMNRSRDWVVARLTGTTPASTADIESLCLALNVTVGDFVGEVWGRL